MVTYALAELTFGDGCGVGNGCWSFRYTATRPPPFHLPTSVIEYVCVINYSLAASQSGASSTLLVEIK